MAPTTNRGITYQTDEKHLTKLVEYIIGDVNIALYCSNNFFLFSII
jgi:hypothetical protein